MEEAKMEEGKVYPDLVVLTMEFGEVYLDLFHNLTVKQAKKKANPNNLTSIVLTPENGLAVANGLIDAAFASKVKNKPVAKAELPDDKEK
jgi:hypothetical protein